MPLQQGRLKNSVPSSGLNAFGEARSCAEGGAILDFTKDTLKLWVVNTGSPLGELYQRSASF